MKLKLHEWLRRYGTAEFGALIGSFIAAYSVHFAFGNPILTALAGTWGDNFAYYGRILYIDIRERRRKDQQISFVGLMKVLRNEIVEFGPAEYFDSFFIRPFAMYFFMRFTDNVAAGLLLGKIIADVTFYIPTLIGYEIRKKYLKD